MSRRHQQSRHALGSTAYLTIVSEGSEENINRQFAALWARIDTFEQRFSRFILESELSTFNAEAGKRREISPEFAALLHTARRMARKTNGLYNPFVLPALQTAGYVGSWPTPEHLGQAGDYRDRRVAPITALHLGKGWAEIPPHTALDFGGIGKGYLLDELAAAPGTHQLAGFWFSLGGDILCSGRDEDGSPWSIGIQDAHHPNKLIGTYQNQAGRQMAVATSGTTKRRGIQNGKPWHHLIDPRTGEPTVTDVLTATVCCTTATEADVYAKCFVIDTTERARTNALQFGIQAAVLQTSAQSPEHKIVTIGETPHV